MDTTVTKELASKMVDLKLEEISGVDDPANLVPGWLVMKSSNASTAYTELEVEAEEIAKAHNALMLALQSAKYLEHAPPEVQQAVAVLFQYLQMLSAEEGGEGAAPPPPPPAHAHKSLSFGDLPPEEAEPLNAALASIEDFAKHRGKSGRIGKLEEATRSLRELYDLLGSHHEDELEEATTVTEEATASTTPVAEASTPEVTTPEVVTTEATTTESVAAAAPAAEATTPTTVEAPSAPAAPAPAFDLSSIETAISSLASKLDSVSKAIDEKVTAVQAAVDEKIGEVVERVETVEKARGVRKGLDGQDISTKPNGSPFTGMFFRGKE